MQRVTRDVLVQKAISLLSAGTVDRVLGWKAGEFSYDVTPYGFQLHIAAYSRADHPAGRGLLVVIPLMVER